MSNVHPIPTAAWSQHIAVLGKTGSGKTYAIKSLVEAWLRDRRRVCIIDPTGAWWGLRSSRDGKSAGFSILVLGGEHGDLPLPATGGAAVARLVVEQAVNVIIDTSALTVGEKTRWFIDFASNLYRGNREPLHLIVDEAHEFAPQGKVPDPDTGKMLHAANRLASGGRSRGIRLTMITQRPAKLHKDSLTCADTLLAMRVVAPQDRQAVKDWIDGCGDGKQGKEVLDSLANLTRGEGWVWYPEGQHLERSRFPAITTFDSSATPTGDGKAQTPRTLADVNLQEISAAMADAVREAEANDPKRLRARIAELERAAKTISAQSNAVDASVIKELKDRNTSLAAALEEARRSFERVVAVNDAIRKFVFDQTIEIPKPPASVAKTDTLAANRNYSLVKAPPRKPPAAATASIGGFEPNGAQRRVLDALLTIVARTGRNPSREQLGWWAGIKPTGGYFNNTIGPMITHGLIERTGDGYTLTPNGASLAWVNDASPIDLIRPMLNGAQSRMFDVLLRNGGRFVSRDELGSQCEPPIDPSGGYFNNTIGPLVTGGLVRRQSGSYALAEWLA